MAYWTFYYKIKPREYILKNEGEDVLKKIRECLILAAREVSKVSSPQEIFRIKIGDETHLIPIAEIIFFEYIGNRKINLYTQNKLFHFTGAIKKLADESPDFYYCHKSFVINLKHVIAISPKHGEVTLSNHEVCLVSEKKVKELLKLLDFKK